MKIAIRGHQTRKKKVARILENLGGKNHAKHTFAYNDLLYYLDSNNHIICVLVPPSGYREYTLEEFEKEFPFKIGDRVISTTTNFIATITKLKENGYYIKYDNGNVAFTPGQNLKLYKEMKEERNITLTLDKAKEWYNKGGELKEVALQAFTEKELNLLPKSWKEFCERYSKTEKEAYIGVLSEIYLFNGNNRDRDKYSDRNICPSKKSAEAHLAMMQLEQLRNCWWNGWEPIWDISHKWCIRLWGNELSIGVATNVSRFLTFPTKEMAEEFLECFRDLIEKAGDLI